MNQPFRIGLMAGLIAAAMLATLCEPALAKKASVVHKQPPIFYRSSDHMRCVERSFSFSVGNPAYKNRLATWPAPCGR
jgi:hypothetical protein